MDENAGNTDHSFFKYLQSFAVQKGNMYSHTSLKPPGTFYVPNSCLEEFYHNYSNAIKDSLDLHLSEAHRYISPILIDLDLKIKSDHDISTHIYTSEHVFNITETYCKYVSESFIIPAGYIDVYVMEKKRPSFNKKAGIIKDGIHIVFPSIVTKCNAQYALRKMIMPEIKEIIADINCMNTIEDIVDEAIIEKNNWMLYGSKKPGGDPYMVTRKFKYNCIENELHELNESECIIHTLSDYISMFSIRNKFDDIGLTELLIPLIQQIDKESETKRNNESYLKSISFTDECNNTSRQKRTCTNIDQVLELIDILSPERVSSYIDWIRLGWCLRNIDDRLLDKWDEFSKHSTKYIPGECKRVWRQMKKGGLGIGTLHMWAKTDNLELYRNILRKDLQEIIFQSRTCTHNDVARVIYHMYQYEYVCSSIKYRNWYEFKNHRWYLADSAHSLRSKISNEVWREYVAAARDWSQKALDSVSDNKQSTFQENAKKMSEIALKLKITSFKQEICPEAIVILIVSFYIRKPRQTLIFLKLYYS